MNWDRKIWIVMLAGVLTTGAAPGATVAPSNITLDQSQVTLSISDLKGMIDRFGGVLGKVRPDMDATNLKAMLGLALSDPELKGLPDGGGLAGVMFAGNVGVLFIEVDPSMTATYSQALAAEGRAIDTTNGLLLLAANDNGLAKGLAVARQVKERLLARREGGPSCIVTVRAPNVISEYDTKARTMMASFPLMASQMQTRGQGPEGMARAQKQARIIEAQMRAMYSIACQVQSLHARLTLPDGGIRVDMSLRPTPGTNLATFLAAPGPEVGDLMGLLPSRGAARGVYTSNLEAYEQLVKAEAVKVGAEMGLSAEDVKPLAEWMVDSQRMNGAVGAIDAMRPGQPLLSGASVVRDSDPKALLESIAALPERMAKTGALKFQADLGMPLTVEFHRNVGAHDGVAIHQLAMSQEYNHVPPEQAKALTAIVGKMNYDIAVVGDTIVYALAGQSIEELIDAVKTGEHPNSKGLRAMEVLERGGGAYADLSVGGMLEFLAAAAGNLGAQGAGPPLNGIAALLAGADPVSLGLYEDSGGVRMSVLVPSDLIGRITSAGQAMAPQPGAPAKR